MHVHHKHKCQRGTEIFQRLETHSKRSGISSRKNPKICMIDKVETSKKMEWDMKLMKATNMYLKEKHFSQGILSNKIYYLK